MTLHKKSLLKSEGKLHKYANQSCAASLTLVKVRLEMQRRAVHSMQSRALQKNKNARTMNEKKIYAEVVCLKKFSKRNDFCVRFTIFKVP